MKTFKDLKVKKVPSLFMTDNGNIVVIKAPLVEPIIYLPMEFFDILPKKFTAIVFSADDAKVYKVMATKTSKVKGRNLFKVYLSKALLYKHIMVVIPLGSAK